ncbi:class I SAM-dependent methyltransferase [Thalassobacillus hwangdonensis]|uniref:Class I SAM-dependent methyltransferase n=1 Tax=Thalassobacillus hwangdonensis TaxID=546108 RepID=A0ABW3L0W6_9BACI
MDWIKDFYTKQYKWMGTDDEALFTFEEQLIEKVEKHSGPVKNLLELGGGKGHFAVMAAKRGYEVTVIELIPEAVEHMKALAKEHKVSDNLQIIEGDFYKVKLEEKFDVICYWDGFGIGADTDQRVLIKRMREWLRQGGDMYMDIYTPWYWAKVAGKRMQLNESISRAYDFDPEGCRMLDTWWQTEIPSETYTQSLRCYSPADLQLLVGNEWAMEIVGVGGAMDYEKGTYHESVPLNKAMSYLVKLEKERG